MNPKNYARTIRALEECVADASRPEKLRRMAALRLSRLRAAARPATGTTTTRTKPATAPKPATPPVPTQRARYEALEAFLCLARQRSALYRKRCNAAEYEIKATMVALMPAAVPTTDDAKAWTDFIAQVSCLLEEIKNIKPL